MLQLTIEIQDLFARACKLGPNSNLDDWLEAQGANAQERDLVTKLLIAHRKSGDFLDSDCWERGSAWDRSSFLDQAISTSNAGDKTSDFLSATADLAPGSCVGMYELIQHLDSGGMGQVWLARRPPPVDMLVAMKVLVGKSSDPRQVIQFESETRSLMRLNHPNIARIFDGGWYNEHPYVVMEFIDGSRLNDIDLASINLRDRLRLCLAIGQAIHYAHQRGILHRDLKPGNVMLVKRGTTSPSWTDRVKLIDFGLAFELPSPLSTRSNEPYTETYSTLLMGGTLEFMPPEQAAGRLEDVDVRSDIYGFGGLIYFVLTEGHPWQKHSLRSIPRLKALETICNEIPPKPSEAIATRWLSTKAVSYAKHDRCEIGSDIDWIVMKCLAKNPADRYSSMAACLDDIQRFLDTRPIEARAKDRAYQARKFLQRNRLLVIGGATIALMGILGLAGLAIGWRNTSRSLLLVKTANEATQSALHKAEANEERAIQDRAIAQSVRDFLQNDLLRQADPIHQANSMLTSANSPNVPRVNPTIRELLDRVAARLGPTEIDKYYSGPKVVQAEMLMAVGESYLGVGESAKSIPILERAVEYFRECFGIDDRETMRSQALLANALLMAGKTAESLKLHETLMRRREQNLGSSDREALQSCNNVGWVMQNLGRIAEAKTLYESTQPRMIEALGEKHPDTLGLQNNLAICLQQSGHINEALALIKKVASVRGEVLGSEHPETLRTQGNVGSMALEQGEVVFALKTLEDVRTPFSRHYAEDHPATMSLLSNLALAYQRSSRNEEAVELLESIVDIKRRKQGNDHPSTWISISNLALAYQGLKRTEEALALFRSADEFFATKFPSGHALRLSARSNLGGILIDAGDFGDAHEILSSVAAEKEQSVGALNPSTLYTKRQLGVCLRNMKRFAESIALLETTWETQQSKLGPENLDTCITRIELALAMKDSGEVETAKVMLKELLPTLQNKYGDDHSEAKRVLEALK